MCTQFENEIKTMRENRFFKMNMLHTQNRQFYPMAMTLGIEKKNEMLRRKQTIYCDKTSYKHLAV